MKIGAMVESFRLGFRAGVEKAAELGIEGIQAYATYGELAPENMTADKVRETLDIVKSNGLVFSALFSLYANQFMDLSLYGSMAAMAMTMLWLFYCQYILLIGAAVCAWKKEAVSLKTAS